MADMPMTGAEYAQLEKTDTLTAYGLQDSLLAAIGKMKQYRKEHAGEPVTAEQARLLLKEAVTENAYLKAAGTQQLATRYFDHVIMQQGDTSEKRDEKIGEFLNLGGLAYTAGDIRNLRNLKAREVHGFGNTRAKAVGLAFKHATKNILGIAPTGLEHFQATIRTPGFTDDLIITPAAFDDLKLLEGKHQFLQSSDRGIGGDKVIHLIAAPDLPAEAAFKPIIEAARRLRDGSATATEDVAAVHAQALALRNPMGGGEAIAPVAVSAEEGKILGQKLLNTIPRLRAGEATIEHFIDIITGKDKENTAAPMQDQSRAAPLDQFLSAVRIAESHYGAPREGDLLASAPLRPRNLALLQKNQRG